MLTSLALGLLIARNASIVGDKVVYTCVYRVSSTTEVTIRQDTNCELVKEIK
jgi:hypothetical protein